MGTRISGRLVTAIAVGGAIVPIVALGSDAHAAVQPAQLSLDQACYVITSSVPTMTITGSVFAPGVPVVITSSSGKLSAKVTADASGDISTSVASPTPSFTRPSEQRETITATQTPGPGEQIVGTAHTYITALGAEHGSTRKEPGLKALTETTTWSFSGFPVGKTIYAHYLIKGRQVAVQAFGRAPAPCGVLTVRRPLFPGTPQHRSYPLQIDTSRPLVKNTAPKITRLRVALALEF
jgi:hypothetical protein